jgi:NitT/TauT family transport system substrate-binding protein
VVERDLPFYDPAIGQKAVSVMNGFARSIGLLAAPVAYEDTVATRFRDLWLSGL